MKVFEIREFCDGKVGNLCRFCADEESVISYLTKEDKSKITLLDCNGNELSKDMFYDNMVIVKHSTIPYEDTVEYVLGIPFNRDTSYIVYEHDVYQKNI